MSDLLQVKNLDKYFPIHAGLFSRHVGDVKAVDDVSFSIARARRSAWSANPAPAKRRSAALASPAAGNERRSALRRPERVPLMGGEIRKSAERCRSSSRIRSPRSTRA